MVVSTALVHCGDGIFTKLQLSLAALQALRSTKEKDSLLLVSVESAALLGVDEVVPVYCQHWHYSFLLRLMH
jgi:uncharacterized protein YjiK